MFGSKQKGDSRIRNILTSADIKYEVDDDGDYKVIFKFDDGRTQLAFINSKTETFAGEEVREVWSVGLRGKGQLSAAVANGLLAKNHQYKVGSWETLQQAGEVLAIFRVSLSADASQSELISVLQMVAMQADEVEKEFLGNDDL